MGKDRSGKFHPKKGKPSGSKEEGLGLRPTMPPEDVEKDLEMMEKTTIADDTLSPDLHLLHPNRHPGKKHAKTKTAGDNNTSNNNPDVPVENTNPTPAEELDSRLTKEAFAALAGYEASPAVTFYLATHRSGKEVNEQQDVIAFKNQLQETEQLLKQKNIDSSQVSQLLAPAYQLLEDEQLWRNLTEGLACFAANNYFKFMRLPDPPENEIYTGNAFYVAPLIPLLSSTEYFFLLVMSKKRIKFYRGDKYGLEAIHVKELPDGVDDVVHFEEKDGENLFRTGGRGGTGGANFHGIGSGKPDEKKNIELYLEEADDTLWKEILHNETAPLLLAGIEYMIPIYKSVSGYGHIWEEPIVRGALEYEDDRTLHEMAMEKMKSFFSRKTDKAKEDFGNKSGGGLVSAIARDIIPASYYGKVDTLFARRKSHVWGRFDPVNNEVEIHDKRESNDDCLINKAISNTILHGGNVHIMDAVKMPAKGSLAAIYRYE
jgi:hypothetical protein